ncbi:hypothetical protein, partial [Spelaeicoccus albus]
DAVRLAWHGRRAPMVWTAVTCLAAGALAVCAWPVASGPWPRSVLLGVVAGATPALGFFDVRLHRLPDRIVWPGIAACAACLAAEIGRSGAVTTLALGSALTGAAGGAFFAGIRALPGSGLGKGDIKTAVLLGLAAGAVHPVVGLAGLLVGVVAAGLAALALVAAGRRSARDSIAYGPFLLFGAWTSVIAAGALSVGSSVCCVG